jgi:hypothetical protein
VKLTRVEVGKVGRGLDELDGEVEVQRDRCAVVLRA